MTVKRRESRDTQRTAENTPPKTDFLCRVVWYPRMTWDMGKRYACAEHLSADIAFLLFDSSLILPGPA